MQTGLPFTLRDVLTLLGYHVGSTHTANIDCCMCKRKKTLNFNFEKEVFRCAACGFFGNAMVFYASQMNMTNKEAYHDISERLRLNEPVQTARFKRVEKEEVEEIPLADIKIRSQTNSAFLSECTLSEKHRQNLLERGFSEAGIVNAGYMSYPKKTDLQDICFRILQQGCELKGVPMFYRDKNNKWTAQYSKSGILVPYRDFNNRIQGFQVRIDDELIEPDEPKYKWISSKYRKDGCGAKTFIHYACDFAWDVNAQVFKPIIRNNTVVVTEGGMKGELFYHLTGQATIALPGVNCTDLFTKELKKLKKIGVKNIVLAYDMDFLTNIHVMTALSKIREIVLREDFKYTILTWDAAMKYQDGSNVDIPLFKNSNFNVFIYTPKTLKKDLERGIVNNTLEQVKKLGITNLFYSVSDINDVAAHELWPDFKKIAAGFHYKPIIWNLTYKGIDDFYAAKKCQ